MHAYFLNHEKISCSFARIGCVTLSRPQLVHLCSELSSASTLVNNVCQEEKTYYRCSQICRRYVDVLKSSFLKNVCSF